MLTICNRNEALYLLLPRALCDLAFQNTMITTAIFAMRAICTTILGIWYKGVVKSRSLGLWFHIIHVFIYC